MRCKARYLQFFAGLLLVTISIVELRGQQPQQYTMNMLDKYRFNPAYGGMDASLSVTGAFKSQWEGLPNPPGFQHVTAHMPLYIGNGGVGVQFFHDKIGVEEGLGFQASYNYVHQASFGLISAGLSVGLIQKSIDGSALRTPDGVYEGVTIIHNDPILSSTVGNGLGSTAGFGVYFANDFLEVGLAVDQITGSTIVLNNAEETTFKLRRTVYGFVEYGYVYSDEIQIYPSVFVKSDGVQTQIDVGGRFDYRDFYFGGVSFRGYNANTIDALALFLGTRVSPKLSLSYGYDITLSKLSNYAEATHEIVVHYNLGKPIGVGKPQPVIYNPRF